VAYKILVVDDELEIVELIRLNLETDEYSVFRATTGVQAPHLARRHLPDLILLDLMLRDMDAFSVCDILRCQPSTANIPVILLTAMAGETPHVHGLQPGAAGYCVKPVSANDLKAKIKSVLATGPSNLSVSSTDSEPEVTVAH
jgi:two-component system alkaline phosphatase synthesis response regulator PhoP